MYYKKKIYIPSDAISVTITTETKECFKDVEFQDDCGCVTEWI